MVDAFESGSMNPWPHKFAITDRIDDFVEKYSSHPGLVEKGSNLDEEVSVAGRVMLKRKAGRMLIFYDLMGLQAKLQVISSRASYEGEDYDESQSVINRGDIIGIVGFPSRSRRGEFSITAKRILLLSPCLHMLPKGPSAFSDTKLRFRKRYLDFIISPESRRKMLVRSQTTAIIRRELGLQGFMEVETPIFNPVKGGASAKPFTTHHNSLDMEMFLRIAPELYLKMLIVGGLERVFEIGKSFRNESIDHTHMPEFTTMECYCAFMDYFDLMVLTENLISKIVKEVTGSYVLTYASKDSEPVEMDFSPPWKRIPMISTIEERAGITFPRPLNCPEAKEVARAAVLAAGIELEEPHTMTRMLDALTEHYIEGREPNPIFVIDHPQIMSPLAKYHRDSPDLTERFEAHVLPFEIANAYTELNNPIVQRENFEAQVRDKMDGDGEAMEYDEVFCQALEHGLPPTGGLGIGIDRLVMLLTNSYNIKEVISFPMSRKE
eukprot:gnl/Chilomastix_cuspidata/338.p1 GENE.gnl/Chilomastix_cuspidata/338~~gnl/Chilomastix_cuspidata/338.p1  ORF type:complete len:557 (+),score=199.35 gnl/Chilomastix_cuspidata/338:194-1672(+)